MISLLFSSLTYAGSSTYVDIHAGGVTNDPFIKRYIAGASVRQPIFQGVALNFSLNFSPDLNEADWKPLTEQLVTKNSVSPDISKIGTFGSVTFDYPLFTLQDSNLLVQTYVKGGFGATQTKDDLKALQAEEDPNAIVTQVQVHATLNWGLSMTIEDLSNTVPVAVGFSLNNMQYVETISSTSLEMKNNRIVLMSFIIPIAKGEKLLGPEKDRYQSQ